MSKETESKQKESTRVIVISFDNSEASDGVSILRSIPHLKGDHIEVLHIGNPIGETAKDWISGFAKETLESAAEVCAKKIAKEGISINWLSSSEIVRASKDVSVNGIVFEKDYIDSLRIKNVSLVEVPSFPVNEFFNLLVKNLA